jgi:hypothetical protein
MKALMTPEQIALAEVLRGQLAYFARNRNAVEVLEHLAHELVAMHLIQNPQFNGERFLAVCGLDAI